MESLLTLLNSIDQVGSLKINFIQRLDLHISHDAFNEEAFKKLLGLLQKNELEPINLKEDIYNRARINFQLVDKFLKII